MNAVVELTKALVRFNTVNPPGNEETAVRHLGDYLAESGIEVEYQRLAEDRVSLIARIGGSGTGHLVLSGHMDVVHPGASPWEHDPFGGEVVDGRLIGRGSADMKGGVAAMAVAMVELRHQGFRPKADLILAVTAGEEVDMAGARLIASSDVLAGATSVVIGEPTGLDVFRAEKGVLWLQVSAHGRTAHGSMPQLGVNSISYMSEVIHRLQEYPFTFQESAILGMPTLSVNVMHGGVKVNVVPDRCVIEVDMRLVPGQDGNDIRQAFQRILDEVSDQIPAGSEIEVLQSVPAVETPEDDPLVAVTVAAAGEARGNPPTVGGVSYGTDGAIIAPALGASLVVFGPGRPGQAHQPNEYVDIDELERAVVAYKLIAQRLLDETASPD